MSKPFRENNKFENLVQAVGVTLILLVFTLFAFFIPQECDLDAIYVWCRLHPTSLGDIIGLTLFYAGGFGLSGIWRKWFTLWEEENTTKWNIFLFGMMAVGAILFWNL